MIIPATGGPLPTENYFCDCGLVQYFRKPEGYFAASHIFIDGQNQRFTYGLFRRHEELHRKLGIGTVKA